MKRVIMIHGWGGSPEQDWFPWLKKELESKGFEVKAPEMPDAENPKIEPWVSKIKDVVGTPDENTYLIGESIGCQTIMRYLESLSEDIKVGGVIFIAGWFNLTDETWDEDYTQEKAEPWINTPIDFEKVKKHTDKFIEVISKDDPYVPLSDTEIFKEKLNAEIIVEHGKGHFDKTTELPIVLEKLLEMSKCQ